MGGDARPSPDTLVDPRHLTEQWRWEGDEMALEVRRGTEDQGQAGWVPQLCPQSP